MHLSVTLTGLPGSHFIASPVQFQVHNAADFADFVLIKIVMELKIIITKSAVSASLFYESVIMQIDSGLIKQYY